MAKFFASLITAIALFASVTVHRSQEPTVQPQSKASPQSDERAREHSKLYKSYPGNGDLRDVAAKSTGDVEVLSGAGQKIFFPDSAPIQLADVISTLSRQADLIVLGTVNEHKSFLTEKGTFVFTDYALTIEQIIKSNPKAQVAASDTIVVTRPGGTIQLNGRNIRAVDESVAPFESGKRYLLFLDYIPSTNSYKAFKNNGAFTINRAKTAKLTNDRLPTELENGVDLAVVVSLIQASLR